MFHQETTLSTLKLLQRVFFKTTHITLKNLFPSSSWVSFEGGKRNLKKEDRDSKIVHIWRRGRTWDSFILIVGAAPMQFVKIKYLDKLINRTDLQTRLLL